MIDIHDTAKISPDLLLKASCIAIGPMTRINGPGSIRGKGTVTIGGFCAVGYGLTILTSNHHIGAVASQLAFQREWFGVDWEEKKTVRIGHDVWIGDNVTILPGVEIGDGAIVGAGSVVSSDVNSFDVFAGIPARKLRDRFIPEVKELLLNNPWWEWPLDRIKRNAALFSIDLAVQPVEDLADILRNCK